MPSTTLPKGEKPIASSRGLLTRLMKTWVLRVSGWFVLANVMEPRWLLSLTGSSWMVAVRQALETSGRALIPNCTTKPGTTRKKLAPS